MDGWMAQFNVLFNSISVKLKLCKGDNEGLCANGTSFSVGKKSASCCI